MKSFILNFAFFIMAAHAHAIEQVNVKTFGARGDGKTDDTRSIQAAINSANPLSGTVIYFPAGIYIIASYTATRNYLENYCLLLHSNLDIKGAGSETIIRLADHIFDNPDSNANAHIFYGSKIRNISFSNLMIDMNGSNNLVPQNVLKNHSAIFTSFGKNYHLHNITVKNCSGTNMINIMGKGIGLMIENCKFLNGGNYVGDDMPNKNQVDFSFIYSEWDSTIVRNNIMQQQNIDIGLANFSGGIEIHGSYSSVLNNSIEGCWPAIYITSSNNLMENIEIKNNRIINCVTGISFWLINPIQTISISKNTIQLIRARSPKNDLCAGIIIPNGNVKEYNKNLANAAPISNLRIEGNTIQAETMSTLSAGIVVHSLQHSNIRNNIIKGMNYGGIVLTGSKWGTDSLLINNNNFVDFKPNNHENIVGGYLIITDTYSPGVSEAPGIKGVVFTNNKLIRKKIDKNIPKGKFFGGFIALPSKMTGGIKFEGNKFSIPSESIHIIKTDQ